MVPMILERSSPELKLGENEKGPLLQGIAVPLTLADYLINCAAPTNQFVDFGIGLNFKGGSAILVLLTSPPRRYSTIPCCTRASTDILS